MSCTYRRKQTPASHLSPSWARAKNLGLGIHSTNAVHDSACRTNNFEPMNPSGNQLVFCLSCILLLRFLRLWFLSIKRPDRNLVLQQHPAHPMGYYSEYANLPAGTPPPGVVPDLDNPPSRALDLYIGMGICISVTAVLLALRMYAKFIVTHSPGWDDRETRHLIFYSNADSSSGLLHRFRKISFFVRPVLGSYIMM